MLYPAELRGLPKQIDFLTTISGFRAVSHVPALPAWREAAGALSLLHRAPSVDRVRSLRASFLLVRRPPIADGARGTSWPLPRGPAPR
jgi:hypothetical protein